MLHIPVLGPALGQAESHGVARDDPNDLVQIGSRGSNPVLCLSGKLQYKCHQVWRGRSLADLWLKRKRNAIPLDPSRRRAEFLLWSLSDDILWPVPSVPLHTERICRVP